MKAAVYHGIQKISIDDMPNPVPHEDNMIAAVYCCAICGTDLKTYTVGNPKFKPPVIIGHEMVGKLVHIGGGVQGFALGDYVTLATTVACGDCFYCKKGLDNLCLNTKPISSYYSGAFADFIEIPAQAIKQGNVIKIPQGGSYSRYALCEPLSCAINAQELAGIEQGDKVLIVGGGPLGAIHAELARVNGASLVMVADISEKRLKLLKRLKDVVLINSETQSVDETVKSYCDGFGADVLIVCAPAPPAFEDAPKYVRKGGRISFFASLPVGNEMLYLNSRLIHYNELRLTGASDSRPIHVQRAVELIAENKIDCDAIITHAISLEEIHKGFDLMAGRQSLKVLVYPDKRKVER